MGVRHPRTLAGRRPSPPTLILAALLTVSVVLLVLLALGTFSLPVDSKLGRARRSVHEAKDGVGQRGERWTEVLSWEPGAKGLRLSQFPEHGEGLQILHYEVGQKYEPHYDYFLDEFNTKNGGQRLATILMYLSDVEEGGETVFPSAKVNSSSLPWYNELSECGKKGLSVKPKMGDALLFWSMRPYATLDPSSLHGGCPVIKGNKQSSTKWIHDQAFRA